MAIDPLETAKQPLISTYYYKKNPLISTLLVDYDLQMIRKQEQKHACKLVILFSMHHPPSVL
jgi:hypothetical protein